MILDMETVCDRVEDHICGSDNDYNIFGEDAIIWNEHTGYVLLRGDGSWNCGKLRHLLADVEEDALLEFYHEFVEPELVDE